MATDPSSGSNAGPSGIINLLEDNVPTSRAIITPKRRSDIADTRPTKRRKLVDVDPTLILPLQARMSITALKWYKGLVHLAVTPPGQTTIRCRRLKKLSPHDVLTMRTDPMLQSLRPGDRVEFQVKWEGLVPIAYNLREPSTAPADAVCDLTEDATDGDKEAEVPMMKDEKSALGLDPSLLGCKSEIAVVNGVSMRLKPMTVRPELQGAFDQPRTGVSIRSSLDVKPGDLPAPVKAPPGTNVADLPVRYRGEIKADHGKMIITSAAVMNKYGKHALFTPSEWQRAGEPAVGATASFTIIEDESGQLCAGHVSLPDSVPEPQMNEDRRDLSRADERSLHAELAAQATEDQRPPERQSANMEEEMDKLEQRLRDKRMGAELSGYENLTVSIDGKGAEQIRPMLDFNSCEELGDNLRTNLATENFTRPTPIQKYAIPIILRRNDVMAAAQTGSGKTLAFLCPMIANILKDGPIERPFFEGKLAMASPIALILAPTRELAIQIDEQVFKMTKCINMPSFAVFGGDNWIDQVAQISKAQIDILTATPGRLIDLMEHNKVCLAYLRYVCIDEADSMLDMGFEEAINTIISGRDMPPKDRRQTLMFSATFPEKIQLLAKEFLRSFMFVKIGKVGSTTEAITQLIKWVENEQKNSELLLDLRQYMAETKGKVIVFVGKRGTADNLAMFLQRKGFAAGSLHGQQSQWQREESIMRFKDDQFKVLCATSVAARGLDFPEVSVVINYDMPPTLDIYTHRIGRTGRIGCKGLAISYFNHFARSLAPGLVEYLRKSKQEIPHWLYKLSGKIMARPKIRNNGKDWRQDPKWKKVQEMKVAKEHQDESGEFCQDPYANIDPETYARLAKGEISVSDALGDRAPDKDVKGEDKAGIKGEDDSGDESGQGMDEGDSDDDSVGEGDGVNQLKCWPPKGDATNKLAKWPPESDEPKKESGSNTLPSMGTYEEPQAAPAPVIPAPVAQPMIGMIPGNPFAVFPPPPAGAAAWQMAAMAAAAQQQFYAQQAAQAQAQYGIAMGFQYATRPPAAAPQPEHRSSRDRDSGHSSSSRDPYSRHSQWR